jgi:hypothetical protein
MAVGIQHVMSLVELSQRRHAPRSADLQRGLHHARVFEADPSTPIALRSLAWQVITESHAAAGWPMPDGERFPSCCGGAASAKHGCAMLMQDVAEQVSTIDGPVLLLGALAASRSVFGDWNTLPASGAFLVPLDADAGNRPPADVYRSPVGVRWGAPGDLRKVFARRSTKVELSGVEVLIPTPELITARTAGCANQPVDLECLIFVAAAHASVLAGKWADAVSIAPRLGPKNLPLDTAMGLGIDRWLGLKISAPRRAAIALRRLLGHGRAA